MSTQSLFERLHAHGRVPTPPVVVVRLLELSEREDVTVQEISDTVALDPALAGKILRFANSPLAGARREVTSLLRAVSMMGVRGVKMSALSFAVLGSTKVSDCPGFDLRRFNLLSICCGVGAKMIADRVDRAMEQEAFLGGLLSQLGRTVMANGLAREYGEVLARSNCPPRDLPALEIAAFGESYAQVGGDLLRSWRLPDTLCDAVYYFRADDAQCKRNTMSRILDLAESAATIVCPPSRSMPADPASFRELGRRWFGLAADEADQLLAKVASESEQLRKSLDIPGDAIRPVDELQEQLRDRIAELSLAMHMENKSMADQQQDLLRKATTDALTGVGNRAAFDTRLAHELDRANRTGTPVALLLMDVDHFKKVNDTLGHQAGDAVLKNLAAVLENNVRKIDYTARYGGEEFAVIAPEISPNGAMVLAERLRHAVMESPVRWEKRLIRPTISIGVAVVTEFVAPSAAATVLRQADEQLYAAKEEGRNRVRCCVNGQRLPSKVVAS